MTEPVLDAHVHVWELAVTPQPWIPPEAASAIQRDFTVEDLHAVTAGAGIDAALLIQSVNQTAETDALLAHAAALPWVAGVVGWLDLRDPDAPARLAERRAGPDGRHLCGLRHVPDPGEASAFLGAPEVARCLEAVGELDLAFDLLLGSDELGLAASVALRHPETHFILDHLAKPSLRRGEREPWRKELLALGRLENVWVKLSGLPTEADWATWTAAALRPYLEDAWAAFGPDRLIFATDWPVCTVAGSYATVVEAQLLFVGELSVAERRGVLWDNARRAYGLEDLPAATTAAATPAAGAAKARR